MNTLEKYNLWLNNDNIDSELKKELENMNEKQINDAFYTNVEFGTAGMRGILGAGTNRINVHTILKATKAFAEYIVSNKENAINKGIAIGYDNRHMSKEFAFEAAKLLSKYKIKTYVFESLRPTPELSFALRYLKCFGGIMITASHNPKEYNGYKLYDETGCQLIPSIAEKIIKLVNEIEDEVSISTIGYDEKLINIIGKEIDEKYYDEVLNIQLEKNQIKDNIKVVFSPEHGTAKIPVTTILEKAGYKCILVEEQASFDPDFSNTLTPNPEEKQAYELSLKYAEKENADIILVCDPDADRMGVCVKHNNKYELLSGNQTGALLIEYICNRLKEKNIMPNNPVIFNTVVTSDLGEETGKLYGVETEKTLTGFKFIGEKIEKYSKNKLKNYIFGYEESYGSLIKPFVRDKDAPQACLLLCEATAFYKNQNKTLIDVLNEIYEKVGFYKEEQVSITLKGEEGAKKIKQILSDLRNNKLEYINNTKVIKIEDYKVLKTYKNNKETELQGFVSSDVLKYFLEDGSWIAIRPSGTEPKCKIYFCIKGKNKEEVNFKCEKYIEEMKKLTN